MTETQPTKAEAYRQQYLRWQQELDHLKLQNIGLMKQVNDNMDRIQQLKEFMKMDDD